MTWTDVPEHLQREQVRPIFKAGERAAASAARYADDARAGHRPRTERRWACNRALRRHAAAAAALEALGWRWGDDSRARTDAAAARAWLAT